jgi:hypothetical protein
MTTNIGKSARFGLRRNDQELRRNTPGIRPRLCAGSGSPAAAQDLVEGGWSVVRAAPRRLAARRSSYVATVDREFS